MICKISATIPLIMGTIAFAIFLSLLIYSGIKTMRNRKIIKNEAAKLNHNLNIDS